MRARWLIAFLLSLPLFAQAKHPFTFEDMMKLKRVEEPVVSPDGKWVLFAAVDVDLQANTKTPHVWVVPLNANGGGTGASPVQAERTSAEREIISDQDADRPRWAPDGKRFAFVSTKENGSQIWIADFDGATGTVTAKRRLTNIPIEADGELWSPDGKYILFKSDVYPECDGTPQAEADCNAKKVEQAKESQVKAQIFTHLLYRHWNAYKEGKRTHLLVVAVDGCAPDHVATAASAVGPGGAGDRANEARRASLDRTAEGGCPYVSVPRDLTPGDYDAPVFSLGGQDDYAFSPDGKELCYASNHDAMPAASTNNDLFTVPVDWLADATSAQVLAATKNITAENKAADNTPLYSPDGKYIAYRAQQRPGYESDRFRLMLYERKTGEKKTLTENFDYWPDSTAWAPDSKIIYFTAQVSGDQPLFSVLVAGGGEPKRLVGGFLTIDSPAVTPNGASIVFDGNSAERPTTILRSNLADPEIYYEATFMSSHDDLVTMNRGNGLPIKSLITINNSVFDDISMFPPDTFLFSGAKGQKVEGFLVRPPNFDPNKKYPVKFLIHGGPEGAWGDDWSYRWNPELFAANGYVVIMINFHGSTGYGQKFIDAINGDWGGAPFEDLMKGLDYAQQHYPFIDRDRECALGASYGGWMANWILGHTHRFKCIVTHDGMFNTESAYGDTEELWFPEWEFKGTPWTNREMYRKWSPHLFEANFKTPTLVIHGQRDYRLDVSQGFDLFTTLQRQGVPSKMLYFPDEGHWVLKPQNSQLWYKTVNDWVDQWMKKK